VPFWVRSPGVVARSDTNIVANIDIAPTVAAWAGITPPGTVNGANLMPLLQNAATPWRQEILIEHLGDIPSLTSSAVRSHQYLYNEYVNGGKEFYELNTDPFQLTNTVTKPSNAAIIAALQATLVQLKAQ
jgi:arylsulfatase A-like enzyme